MAAADSKIPAARAASETSMICRAFPRKMIASGSNVAWASGAYATTSIGEPR